MLGASSRADQVDESVMSCQTSESRPAVDRSGKQRSSAEDRVDSRAEEAHQPPVEPTHDHEGQCKYVP